MVPQHLHCLDMICSKIPKAGIASAMHGIAVGMHMLALNMTLYQNRHGADCLRAGICTFCLKWNLIVNRLFAC